MSKELFLKWWYRHGGRDECGYPHNAESGKACPKDVFLEHRTMWESVQSYIVNAGGKQLTHDEIKAICRRLDKDAKLAHIDYEDVALTDEQRKRNIRETGFSEGIEGFVERAAKVVEKIRRVPESYKQYINSGRWQRRSRRYLDECCLNGDSWICEMCGCKHEPRDFGRTIQVHHNTYIPLNGEEPNEHLMACCEGLCHNLADICRKIHANPSDVEDICDQLRPLFR